MDQEDAQLVKEGEEVTLMDWGNVILGTKSISSGNSGIIEGKAPTF